MQSLRISVTGSGVLTKKGGLTMTTKSGNDMMDALADGGDDAEPVSGPKTGNLDDGDDVGPANVVKFESADDRLADDQQKVAESVYDHEDKRKTGLDPTMGVEAADAATKAGIAEVKSKLRDDPSLSPLSPEKEEFNPLLTQNALQEGEREGGIMRVRAPGANVVDDTQKLSSSYRPEAENADNENRFELSGFTVAYEPVAGAGQVTTQVRNFFDDAGSAKGVVTNGRCMIPVGNKIVSAKIVLGAPIICKNERQLFEYVDGQWRRT